MILKKASLFSDNRGSLGVIEFTNLPFEPKRFFWIYDVPNLVSRAGHGHRTCSQILFCLKGCVEIKVTDKHKVAVEHKLNAGDTFYLEALSWLEITNFGKSGMLGVLASEPYDRNEYIETFDNFMEILENTIL